WKSPGARRPSIRPRWPNPKRCSSRSGSRVSRAPSSIHRSEACFRRSAMAAPEKKKYYTIEEANGALPLVRVIVGDIVAKYNEVSERKSRLDHIRQTRSSSDRGRHDLYREEFVQVEEELEKEI